MATVLVGTVHNIPFACDFLDSRRIAVEIELRVVCLACTLPTYWWSSPMCNATRRSGDRGRVQCEEWGLSLTAFGPPLAAAQPACTSADSGQHHETLSRLQALRLSFFFSTAWIISALLAKNPRHTGSTPENTASLKREADIPPLSLGLHRRRSA